MEAPSRTAFEVVDFAPAEGPAEVARAEGPPGGQALEHSAGGPRAAHRSDPSRIPAGWRLREGEWAAVL